MNTTNGSDADRKIGAFIDFLAALDKSDTKTIWAKVMSEKAAIKRTGHTIATQRKTITGYRNAIRERLGTTHPALKYMNLSIDDMEDLREDYKQRVSESHGNLRPVDCEALVATATAIIRDPAKAGHPMRVAAALLLLTGRRVTEVLKTGEFMAGDKKRTLQFCGQLKQSDSADDAPYTIPVLADPALVLSAIDYLRTVADCSEIDNQKVNARYSKYVNAAVADLFADAKGGRLMPKDLRAIYATAAYAWYAPVTVSLNAYVARILGHSPLDLITSLSYVKFYPLGEKRAFVSDVRWSLDVAIALQEDALEAETNPVTQGYIRERIASLEAVAEAT